MNQDNEQIATNEDEEEDDDQVATTADDSFHVNQKVEAFWRPDQTWYEAVIQKTTNKGMFGDILQFSYLNISLRPLLKS